uniref:3'-N-debenzoyl-2'-deoxytaxol N-benzoyltransferase n=1 Tax=Ananas comosus var. bracteatus TaxID=296719 RepID=A0A6V7NZY4_ANACO|nr:unnamed protein product [Ananas comosus var. bracteatus]
MIPREELLPRPPPEVKLEDTILMAQVTVFKCGGIAVGICFNHLVFDGQGAAQFLKAVGEMARGLPEPSVAPVWSRDAIPDPPRSPAVARRRPSRPSNSSSLPSTYPRCRGPPVLRGQHPHLLHGVLPSVEGYYGNCVYPAGITRTSEEIDNASIVEIVAMIRDAKEALSTRFVDWMNGGAKDNHYNMPLDYGTLTVSDWSRLGFNEVDYGWGEPSYVFPLNDDVNIVAMTIYLKPPAPKHGIRLMLRCVEEEHSAVLCKELLKLA